MTERVNESEQGKNDPRQGMRFFDRGLDVPEIKPGRNESEENEIAKKIPGIGFHPVKLTDFRFIF
jgi:hypothetical protein